MGAQGDGAWIQNGGGQGMYFNQMGMNNLYQDYWANQGGAFSSGQFYPGYQQNYQFTQQYEGGFQGSYMRPAMSFYPMPGMYKMDRRNCFFNGGFPGTIQSPVFPQQAPMFPQVNPTFPQPTPVLPRKTVQPVQPVQHLKVETLPPTQVQPKNSAGGFPIEIPKAKTPWEGMFHNGQGAQQNPQKAYVKSGQGSFFVHEEAMVPWLSIEHRGLLLWILGDFSSRVTHCVLKKKKKKNPENTREKTDSSIIKSLDCLLCLNLSFFHILIFSGFCGFNRHIALP